MEPDRYSKAVAQDLVERLTGGRQLVETDRAELMKLIVDADGWQFEARLYRKLRALMRDGRITPEIRELFSEAQSDELFDAAVDAFS